MVAGRVGRSFQVVTLGLIDYANRDEAVLIAQRVPTLSAGGRVEVDQLAD